MYLNHYLPYILHAELSISDMIITGSAFKQIKKLQKVVVKSVFVSTVDCTDIADPLHKSHLKNWTDWQ